MKIEKSCKPPTQASIMIGEISPGTVFRHGNHAEGVYVKLTAGYVNLQTNTYYSSLSSFTNYLPLPNARLVTGEE